MPKGISPRLSNLFHLCADRKTVDVQLHGTVSRLCKHKFAGKHLRSDVTSESLYGLFHLIRRGKRYDHLVRNLEILRFADVLYAVDKLSSHS